MGSKASRCMDDIISTRAQSELQSCIKMHQDLSNNHVESTVNSAPNEDPVKDHPTCFLDLPGELRNEIYELSGCLRVLQCGICARNTLGDVRGEVFPPDGDLCRVCHASFGRYGFKPMAEYGRIHINRTSKWCPRSPYEHIFEPINFPPYGGRGEKRRLRRDDGDLARVSQPALTRTCKKVREDTLPIWYGNQDFYLTLFGSVAAGVGLQTQPKWLRWAFRTWHGYDDFEALVRWIECIGPRNAGMLRKLTVVGADEKRTKEFEACMMLRLEALGVRTSEGVVELVQMGRRLRWKGRGNIMRRCAGCDRCVLIALRRRQRNLEWQQGPMVREGAIMLAMLKAFVRI